MRPSSRLTLSLAASLALPLAAPAAPLPPGVLIDIDDTNTVAADGGPAPFFTTRPADPGFVRGPLWLKRTGFGFDAAANREVFEKDASGGVGDAAPLVTTVAGLQPGARHAVYVAFISNPDESWRIRAGLTPDRLVLFTPAEPAGLVTDLGRSGEPRSNRNQYLGFIGNITVPADGTLRLHADDGDGAANWSDRSWIEGFFLGAPRPETGALVATAAPAVAATTPATPAAATPAAVSLPVPAAATGQTDLPAGAVQIAPDGAWTWFNDERAIVHQGSLFAGYVLADGRYGVTRYDFADGQSRHAILSTEASRQKDDHNNPSLTVLPDGRILALYSKHIAGHQYYQRTSLVPRPASAADWGPEIVRPTPANNTYANTYRLSGENDRIYNFHRCINFNPTLSVSDDLGATWGEPRQFIGAGTGGTRPYIRLSSDNRERIDVLYTDGHPRDVTNSLYHLYYRAGAFHRTDGSVLKKLDELPIRHDADERGSVIYRYRTDAWGPDDGPDDWIPSGRAWNWDVHQGADGRPVVAFQVQRDNLGWSNDRIYYYYARWTGTEWQKRFIAQAGRPLYSAEDDYGGGMALDPQDPRVVYISSNAADPFALGDIANVPLRPQSRYELWRGFTADGGLTFTWTQLTTDSAKDNLRPIVPPAHGRTECLLWFHGDYRTYTSYSAQVVARIGPPLSASKSGAAIAPPGPRPPDVDAETRPPFSPDRRHPVRR